MRQGNRMENKGKNEKEKEDCEKEMENFIFGFKVETYILYLYKSINIKYNILNPMVQ